MAMGLEGHRSCSVLHKSLPLGLGRLWSGLELSVLCRGQEWPGTDPPFLQAGCELLLPPSTLCTPVLPVCAMRRDPGEPCSVAGSGGLSPRP